MGQVKDQWFTSWFNTPYYHILYKDRDYTEAQSFMDTLTRHLELNRDSHILDLACGRGRHSIYLNKIGFEVTGVDLSPQNIAFARKFENERLHFNIHDMCLPYSIQFDAVFNLFTSFGYFQNEADNLRTIKAIKANLKDSGIAVIDFMNVTQVIKNLVSTEKKTVEGIEFVLNRRYDNGYIVKDIIFSDDGNDYRFQERVRAFHLEDFKSLFRSAQVDLVETFGNYQLEPFKEMDSERLILIFR